MIVLAILGSIGGTIAIYVALLLLVIVYKLSIDGLEWMLVKRIKVANPFLYIVDNVLGFNTHNIITESNGVYRVEHTEYKTFAEAMASPKFEYMGTSKEGRITPAVLITVTNFCGIVGGWMLAVAVLALAAVALTVRLIILHKRGKAND